MTGRPRLVRLAVAGLAGLALFAVLFSVGHAFGWWPEPPDAGFAGTDLAAGVVFGIVLLIVLLRGRG